MRYAASTREPQRYTDYFDRLKFTKADDSGALPCLHHSVSKAQKEDSKMRPFHRMGSRLRDRAPRRDYAGVLAIDDRATRYFRLLASSPTGNLMLLLFSQ